MNEALLFDRLLASGSDVPGRTVSVAIGARTGEIEQIDLDVALAGPLIATLLAEARRVNAALPEEQRASLSLAVNGVSLAIDAEQRPAFIFELEGGTPLPILIDRGDHAALARELLILAHGLLVRSRSPRRDPTVP